MNWFPFNKNSISLIAKEIENVYPDFNVKEFVKNVMKELESLELKDRSRHTSMMLKKYLPDNYKKAIRILINTKITGFSIPIFKSGMMVCLIIHYCLHP